ncbi:hypothetical protein SY86_07585 [Erwinia tracheiphila]|uniref:Uncharacterized protein n=2 Tax=Erwinia tracheiphila TaxID=65700 RepID=A0A0M2KDA8_9GAMM|nr:hypothetical protein ETR_04676 [Erwinia tracheiphila PSU-1]KKF35312.1 hypothetical protein SY86_07585 [Erwinia tracheiphila]
MPKEYRLMAGNPDVSKSAGTRAGILTRTPQELEAFPQSGDVFAVRVEVAGIAEPLFSAVST